MSITVRSNDPVAPAAPEKVGQAAEAKEDLSALAQDANEMPVESDTTDEVQDVEASEGDEASGNDEESDEDSQKNEEQKPKRKPGFKKRIDKLNQRLTERERELEYWREQALKDSKVESNRTAQFASQSDSSGKPNPDNFQTHAEYVEALTDWKVEQKERERETKAQQKSAQTEYESKVKSHSERLQAFVESHKDFQDVIEDVDDVPMSVAVQQVILESENGPALMYELAKNRAEYERICALPAIAAARELGKIEARINSSSPSNSETKEIKTTKAPRPVTPIGAKSGASAKRLDDPNLSQKEYERLRMEHMRKNARG